MESIPRRVKRYIWLSVVPAVAVIALAAAVDHGPSVPRPWLVYPLMIVMAWVGEEYRVLTQRGAYHTLTAAIHLPFILLFAPLEAVLLAVIGCICSQLRRRRSLPRVIYNAVVRAISVGVPSVGLTLWRQHDPHFYGARSFLSSNAVRGIVQRSAMQHPVHAEVWTHVLFSSEVIAGCALVALLYVALDSALVSSVVAVQTATSVLAAWQVNVRAAVLLELTKSVIGIIAACICAINPLFVIFVALPMVIMHATTRALFRLQRETVDAVTALADAIDYRDRYTAQHSVRVAQMSQRLAQRLGLSREQVDEITLAARVHDLGKIGIPNEVLLKDGRLTPEEMAVMQAHPRIGAEVLQKYTNFRTVLPMVLHHHERYDGKGYPDGLAGDAIPLGAQIVAHADAFDAMISDRPYRKGMRPEVALQRVIEATGTQFNPTVAGVFVAMIRADLEAAGQTFPTTGGSLAETANLERVAAAHAEDNVRYLYRT